MNHPEIAKSEAHIIIELIEYIPNCILSRTIIKKSTGNVTAYSFDSGEGLMENISPFDTFAQIIDGEAEIIIDGSSHKLRTGEAIVIPAHRPNAIKAHERFKMLLTIIKSGYED